MAVTFEDYRLQVKGAMTDAIRKWLIETGNEVASHAKRNCAMDGSGEAKHLKGSYKTDLQGNVMQVGSALEPAFWEEFGTGEYAVNGNGRKGWWVYIAGQGRSNSNSKHYASQSEAEDAAKRISKAFHVHAIASNGRHPHFTLRNAFEAVAPGAIQRFEKIMQEGLK